MQVQQLQGEQLKLTHVRIYIDICVISGLLQCSQPVHQLKLDSLSAIGCGEPVPGRDWTDSAHISSTVYTFYNLQGVHCQKGSGRLRLVVVVQGSRKVHGPVFKGESS